MSEPENDDFEAIIKIELLRAVRRRVRRLLDEPTPTSFWDRAFKHPLGQTGIGFIFGMISLGIGSQLRFGEARRQQDLVESRARFEAGIVAARDISSTMYDRSTQAGLLLSALERRTSVEEVQIRKQSYDQSYSKWNTTLFPQVLAWRYALRAPGYSPLESYIQYGLTPHFERMDSMLTVLYDRKVQTGRSPTPQESELVRSLLLSSRACAYTISQNLQENVMATRQIGGVVPPGTTSSIWGEMRSRCPRRSGSSQAAVPETPKDYGENDAEESESHGEEASEIPNNSREHRNSDQMKNADTAYSYTDREHSGRRYRVVEVNLHKADIRVFWKDHQNNPFRTMENLERALRRNKERLLVATNAGIFETDSLPSGIPRGFHIQQGRKLVDLNMRNQPQSRTTPNFYRLPNGVFGIDTAGNALIVERDAAPRFISSLREATQSGPLLVRSGQLHGSLTRLPDPPKKPDRLIRSAVGVQSPRKVFLVVSRDSVSHRELALFLRDELLCPDGLYLDGRISELHLPSHGLYARRDYVGIIGVVQRE